MVHVTMLLELDVLMVSARLMPFRIKNLNHFISAEKYRRPGQLSNGADGFASCIATNVLLQDLAPTLRARP